MKINRNLFLLLLSLDFCFGASGGEIQQKPKLIDLSWSNPTVEYLAENWARMEEETPLDGLVVRFSPKVGSKPAWQTRGESVFGTYPIEYAWYEKQVEMMKAIPFRKLTDNFVYACVSPGNQQWQNNAHWQTVCGNYRILARIAKNAGMKGIFIDLEPYTRDFWNISTFNDSSVSYAERHEVAFRRGQEFGNAIFGEYPDITLFLAIFIAGDNPGSLRDSFLTGLLDVLPDTAKIVDGQEAAGYGARNLQDIDKMSTMFNLVIPRTLPRHLQKKYRARIQFSTAFYLDAILNISEKYYQDLCPDITRTSPVSFLRGNLAYAMKISGDYILLYGEKGCWWSQSEHEKARKTWEQQCPGITQAVLGAKDPGTIKINPAKNLLAANSGDLTKYYFWQTNQSRGVCGSTKETMLADGCMQGSFSMAIPATECKWYLLRTKYRYVNPTTEGTATLGLIFCDQFNRQNFHEYFDFLPLPKNGTANWQEASYMVYVPEGSRNMRFTIGMSLFRKGESVEFKTPQLYMLK